MSADNVVTLDVVTSLDASAERTLREVLDYADLEHVVILGYDRDGDEYFASSYADGGTVLWLMERLKHRLLTSEAPSRKSTPEGVEASVLPFPEKA